MAEFEEVDEHEVIDEQSAGFSYRTKLHGIAVGAVLGVVLLIALSAMALYSHIPAVQTLAVNALAIIVYTGSAAVVCLTGVYVVLIIADRSVAIAERKARRTELDSRARVSKKTADLQVALLKDQEGNLIEIQGAYKDLTLAMVDKAQEGVEAIEPGELVPAMIASCSRIVVKAVFPEYYELLMNQYAELGELEEVKENTPLKNITPPEEEE